MLITREDNCFRFGSQQGINFTLSNADTEGYHTLRIYAFDECVLDKQVIFTSFILFHLMLLITQYVTPALADKLSNIEALCNTATVSELLINADTLSITKDNRSITVDDLGITVKNSSVSINLLALLERSDFMDDVLVEQLLYWTGWLVSGCEELVRGYLVKHQLSITSWQN